MSRSGIRPGPGSPAAAESALPLDTLRVALFALLIVSVSRVHVHLGLGPLRPALVLAVVTGAMAVFNPQLLNTGKLIRHWPTKVVLAIGVLACLSAAFGLSLGASAVFILTDFSKVLITFFLIVAAVRDERDLRFLMWGYVISCAILAYFALFVFTPRNVGGGFYRLGHMYTYDANDIGVVFSSGIPIAILLFQTSGPKGRAIAAAALVGIGAAAALSGSRATFLGLIAVSAALLVLARGVSAVKKLGFILAVGLSLIVFAPPGYWTQMETLLSPKEDYNWNTYYGRKQSAERAAGYMFRFPVFGVGINNFSRAEGTISEKALTFVDRPGYALRWRAVHNSFLEAGSETGITGILLWSSLIFGGIFGLRRLRRKLGTSTPPRGDPRRFVWLAALYLPVSLIGFAATAFFVSFAWKPILYILVAYVCGVYLCADRWLTGAARAPIPAPEQPVPPLRLVGSARRPAPIRTRTDRPIR